LENFIKIRGAKEHNLKNVDLDIPRDKFIVFTGFPVAESRLWRLTQSMPKANVAI